MGFDMSSNGLIAKIIHRDLDLLFEGKKFEMLISLKRLVLVQKCMGRHLLV